MDRINWLKNFTKNGICTKVIEEMKGENYERRIIGLEALSNSTNSKLTCNFTYFFIVGIKNIQLFSTCNRLWEDD